MLGQTKIVLFAVALAEAVSAVGRARVKNQCSFDVTAWSVGSDISGPNTIKSGQSYSEQFTSDPRTGGRAIKITRTPDGLYTGQPQTVFAYNLKDGLIWYDLSDVFGDAFAGCKLVEGPSDTSCPSIVWPQGTPPAGSQVKQCQDGSDVTLTLCSN